MYALASPGVPWAPAFSAWNLRGRRTTSGSPRGLMYALASPGVPWRPLGSGAVSLEFAWQARHLGLSKGGDVRLGVPWRPLRSGLLCLEFAWQARHLGLFIPLNPSHSPLFLHLLFHSQMSFSSLFLFLC